MSEPRTLQDVYSNAAVRDFGRALRIALWQQKDFSSLIDFDGAERPEDFAEALKRFLRRFDSLARRSKNKKFRRPTRESLEEIMTLVDVHGVKLVRAAILSHALVASGGQLGGTSEQVSEGNGGDNDEQ